MKTPLRSACALAAALLCAPALAQPAPDAPPARAAAPPASVPQGGPQAAAIRRTLAGIRLPPGFRIALYALAPDARMIAVGPLGTATFVSTRKDKVYSLADRGHAGAADDVREFAPGAGFDNPNGVCLSPDGVLFVAEQNRILAFPAAGSATANPAPPATTLVRRGDLIPVAEESSNHSARVCRIGPDDKLYVTLGQPYNVPAPGKLALYDRIGMGGIVRMDRDGASREVYARGIRNSVGLDFAADGTLWFTDNQVDGMGDDIPPGEINHATRMGQNFGFPWYGGGHTRTTEYKNATPPADAVFPVVEEVAHAADLGMTIYNGPMFPKEYQGAIFSAQHGSWNRTTPIGARVMVTMIDANGHAPAGSRPFAEGWLDKDGEYDGRPVDVEQMRDGSLLVSDDLAGAVYRITYEAPK